ncbi:hypothetical protein LTR95_001623 [Oleoguttula sp. CCFEE 5521]
MGSRESTVIFSPDKDLQDVWSQLLTEYEQATDMKLDPTASYDALTEQMIEDIRRSRSRNGVRARKIICAVGRCLSTLGQIASQAASVVFGPSAQCWNAISYVISAAKAFGDVLDGFVALMELSLAFLKRLNYFLAQNKTGASLDPHLRGPAYEILGSFLGVLKYSHKLATSKREKFKLVLNVVLFNGDPELSASLAQMETQVKDFTVLTIDQILIEIKGLPLLLRESAEEAQRRHAEIKEWYEHTEGLVEHVDEGVQAIGNLLESKLSQDRREKDCKLIRNRLLGENQKDTWVRRQSQICNNRIPGTAEWLTESVDFQKWANVRTLESGKVWTVTGKSGFGKSYILSHVVSHLEQTYRSGTTPDRTQVLYYYFGEGERNESLWTCLAAFIYQLALLDKAGTYARAIADACQDSSKIETAENLWELFVTSWRNTIQGRCFLCIDGFTCGGDRSSNTTIAKMVKHAKLAQADLKGTSVRLLLTGTPEELRKIPPEEVTSIYNSSLGVPQINSGSTGDEDVESVVERVVNEGDLIAVARSRIEEMREQQPEIADVLEEADIHTIVAGVRGHYETLGTKFNQINACSSAEEVRNIVKTAEEGLDSTTRRNIRSLNASLSPDAIIQLNELLLWLTGCRDATTIDLLQSALLFKLDQTPFLKKLIRTRFSTLLTLDDVDNVKAPNRLRETLSALESSEVTSSISASSATTLSLAEIELCRRFIENACDPHDFHRFGLDAFFEAHARKQTSKIKVDGDDVVELTVLRICVKALTERQTEGEFEALRSYANIWFYVHLAAVEADEKFSDKDQVTLREVGGCVAHLLYDDAAIDAWWRSEQYWLLRQDWLCNDQYHESLMRFLRHHTVAQGYASAETRDIWVRETVAKGRNSYSVLLKIASRLAGRWFSTDLADEGALWSAYGIVAREAGKPYDDWDPPSLQDAEWFAQWARDNTQLEISEAQWNFRKGAAFNGYSDWALPSLMAEIHCVQKQFGTALEYCHKFTAFKHEMEECTESMEVGDQKDSAYGFAYWNRVLLREGECHKNLKAYNAAIQCFQRVLGHGQCFPSSREKAVKHLFETWLESKEYLSIIDLLRTWRDSRDESLPDWMIGSWNSDNVHTCILTAAQHTEAYDEVSTIYQQALDAFRVSSAQYSEDEVTTFALNQLQFFHATILFYASPSNDDHDKALGIWEDLITKQNDAQNSWFIAYKSTRVLFRSLLEKAVAAAYVSNCRYTNRLVKLTEMNHETTRDFLRGVRDPRLSLARVHSVLGRTDAARAVIRDRLRDVFDGWTDESDEDDLVARYSSLAHTLVIADDDINAIAAWQAMKPKGTQSPTSDSNAPLNQSILSPASKEPSTEADATTARESPPTVTEDQMPQGPRPEPYLQTFICDGGCGTHFHVISCTYACKTCVDVQLCPKCHSKLKDNELASTICSSSHEFLYVPAFNETLWAQIGAEEMIVGNKIVARNVWLDGLREEWNLGHEQINIGKLEAARQLKASRCIVKAVTMWVLRKKETAKGSRLPL